VTSCFPNTVSGLNWMVTRSCCWGRWRAYVQSTHAHPSSSSAACVRPMPIPCRLRRNRGGEGEPGRPQPVERGILWGKSTRERKHARRPDRSIPALISMRGPAMASLASRTRRATYAHCAAAAAGAMPAVLSPYHPGREEDRVLAGRPVLSLNLCFNKATCSFRQLERCTGRP
jgi:hypothetical protein